LRPTFLTKAGLKAKKYSHDKTRRSFAFIVLNQGTAVRTSAHFASFSQYDAQVAKKTGLCVTDPSLVYFAPAGSMSAGVFYASANTRLASKQKGDHKGRRYNIYLIQKAYFAAKAC
jgi:hypothetical protein